MAPLRPWLTAVVVLACCGSPALAADPAALDQLVQQAQFWDGRNRPDLAREAWTRVLEADANNLAALERLVDLEVRNGNAATAASYESRLRALAPNSPALQRRSGGDPAVAKREAGLGQARSLARGGDSEAALAAYAGLLDANGNPPADIALEYYETLAGTERGWEAGRDGLRKLEAANSQDQRASLAHARVLTYRAATRREGIEKLNALAERSAPMRSAARSAERNALVWLQASEADRPLYERYLAAVGADAELSEKVAQLASRQKAQSEARAATQRAEALRGGYDALEAGDITGAERFFDGFLRRDANDADARAGLGLVRLRQQRFAEADAALSQAVAAKPALRANFAEALATTRYWNRVGMARAAQQRGEWRAAGQSFEAALAARPNADVDVRRDYAIVLRQLGEAKRAERVLREGLQAQPDSAPLIGAMAELLLDQKRDAELDVLLAKAKPQAPGALRKVTVELMRARAARAVEAGEQRKAEDFLQQALAADGENPWVRLDLARLYRAMGRGSDADALLQSLSETGPEGNPDATLAQAYALSESQRWYETLIVLERVPAERRDAAAVRLQRSSWIRYQLQRAVQAAGVGESAQAVEYLNAAIAAAGDEPEYASAIAQGWSSMGDPARAVAALRRAFAQRSPAPGDSIQYAALLLELGQDAEFEAVTTALIRANAMSSAQRAALEDLIVGYRIKLADRMRENGEIAAAYTQLREVVMRYPNQPRVQMALSRLFISAGDSDKALAMANSMLQTYPDDAAVRLSAVDAALAAGDRAAAEEWIDEARELSPDDPAIDRAAARLAEQRGNRAESLRLLKRAADLEDRERRDSLMPVLALIDPQTQDELRLPDPMRELLSDEAESVGPLLPRAGDAGPAPGSRFGGFRLDAAVGSKAATGAATTQSATGTPERAALKLRLDDGGAVVRKTPADLDDELRRLESSLSAWVASSFATRSRQGEAGLSRLLAIEVPLDVATREWSTGRLGLRVRPVILDAGTPGGRNILRYGTGALVNGEIEYDEQSTDGVGLSLAYQIGELTLDVGTTPLGFEVESVVGGLRWLTRPTERVQLTTELSRRPVTDSLLSYAGAYDPLTGRNWGAVLRTGGRVDVAYDMSNYGLYASGAYYGFGGRNVEENSSLELGGGVFFRVLQSRRFGTVTAGLNVTTFGYDQNLRHFTFGHGGYFSPQFFTAVTVPVSWVGRSGRLDYRVEGAIGLQTFREDGAPLYPGRPALQQELEDIAEFEPTSDIPLGYESQKVSGLGYKLGGIVEYRLSDRLSAGGLVSIDNARDYEESQLQFYLRYHFDDRGTSSGALVLPDLQRGALP